MRIIVACLCVGLLVFSGCVAEPTSEEARPRSVAKRTYAAPATPEPILNVVPVELDGRTMTYACIVAPVMTQCQALFGGTSLETFADADAKPRRLAGTLTWTADTPATANLNAYLVVDGRYQYGFPVAYGSSPVAVDFDLTPYAGHDLALGISSTTCVCPLGAGLVHAGPEDYAFRGEFTSET